MARWEPGARERLERAALELFAEQGFAETTVPQITARAGLTTRTFFRHFADKREVLFADEDDVAARVTAALDAAPAGLPPMQLVTDGLPTLAEALFGGRRRYLRQRNAVVQADAGLLERDLHKRAALTALLREGFVARGSDELTATLAAELATTAMRVSVGRWLAQEEPEPGGAGNDAGADEDPDQQPNGSTDSTDSGLAAVVTETLAALRALAAEA